jgi:hypothetical protein
MDFTCIGFSGWSQLADWKTHRSVVEFRKKLCCGVFPHLAPPVKSADVYSPAMRSKFESGS